MAERRTGRRGSWLVTPLGGNRVEVRSPDRKAQIVSADEAYALIRAQRDGERVFEQADDGYCEDRTQEYRRKRRHWREDLR